MWPIGHVAIAYLLYSASTRLRFDAPPAAVAAFVLAVGSVFPDLVDKPLAWYLGVLPTGRTLAHSMLFLVPVVAIVYLWTRRRGVEEYGIAFGLGAISHSLVDAAPVLWNSDAGAGFLLWPVVSISGYESGAPTLLGLLMSSLTDPYFLSEFVFFAGAVVLWRADGYPGLTLLPGFSGDPGPQKHSER